MSVIFSLWRYFCRLLLIAPSAPTTIGTISTDVFHIIFEAYLQILIFFHFLGFFIIYISITWACDVNQSIFLCPLLTITMSGLLAVIFLSVMMLKSYNSLYASFSNTGSGLCSHQCSALSKFNSLVRLQCTVDATALSFKIGCLS